MSTQQGVDDDRESSPRPDVVDGLGLSGGGKGGGFSETRELGCIAPVNRSPLWMIQSRITFTSIRIYQPRPSEPCREHCSPPCRSAYSRGRAWQEMATTGVPANGGTCPICVTIL